MSNLFLFITYLSLSHNELWNKDITEKNNIVWKGNSSNKYELYKIDKDFPNEFKNSYSKWVKEYEIKPSKYRFLNSNNKLIELDNFK